MPQLTDAWPEETPIPEETLACWLHAVEAHPTCEGVWVRWLVAEVRRLRGDLAASSVRMLEAKAEVERLKEDLAVANDDLAYYRAAREEPPPAERIALQGGDVA